MSRISVPILVLAMAVASLAAAYDVVLDDGTVITADEVTVTGSYVMLTLPNGQKVAYPVLDVNMEALQRQLNVVPEEAAAPVPEDRTATGGRRSLAAEAPLTPPVSRLTITDADVEHVRDGGDTPAAPTAEAPQDSKPAGAMEGGQVTLQGLRVRPVSDGVWRVEGEVVNRSGAPALDVQVELSAQLFEDGQPRPWRATLPLSSSLPPDETVTFQHEFSGIGPEGEVPRLRARVYWMQRGAPAPTPRPDGSGPGGGDEPETPSDGVIPRPTPRL